MGGLEEAVRRESAAAVMHHWRLSAQTVCKWRRALGGRAHHRGQPWTEEEDELVRTLTAQEAAARTGRSVKAIWSRRHKLRVNPAG
jgi:hypothetical protein